MTDKQGEMTTVGSKGMDTLTDRLADAEHREHWLWLELDKVTEINDRLDIRGELTSVQEWMRQLRRELRSA